MLKNNTTDLEPKPKKKSKNEDVCAANLCHLPNGLLIKFNLIYSLCKNII